jgi:hypothetical protein
MKAVIPVEQIKITAFCRKWKVAEFSLFGSVLRQDFHPESDVDVLVKFASDADWSLFDWVDMMDELKAMFGREVDMVEESSLKNPFQRRGILAGREILYAA